MAGTIFLVPLAHVEDVARVVVVADAVVHGWGLVPRFLLLRVDQSFLLMWHRWCGLVKLGPASSRRGAIGLLHRNTLKKGVQLLVGLLSLRVDGLGIVRRRIVTAAMFWLA
jgi:hypothetical protein